MNQAPEIAPELVQYETFVAGSPHGSMTQSVRWASVKANWDADYVYLRGQDGQIRAGMSLLSINDQRAGGVFMYAPRGPVADLYDLETVSELLEQARAKAVERGAFVIRFDPAVPFDEKLVELYSQAGYRVRSRDITDPHGFSQPRFQMGLDLRGKTSDDVLAGFKRSFRNQVRKPYNSGVTTEFFACGERGAEQALGTFYDLTKVMAKRQGITHRPQDYFVRLLQAFPLSRVLVASFEGTALASCIIVPYGRTVHYLYAASSNEMRNLCASNQLNFEAIKYAIELGAEEYDMGGVLDLDPTKGLYLYKRNICSDAGLKEYLGEIDLILNPATYQRFTA